MEVKVNFIKLVQNLETYTHHTGPSIITAIDRERDRKAFIPW